MDQKFLPAILISVLSLGCMAIILRALSLVLARTGWEKPVQRDFLRKACVVIIVWIGSISIFAYKGFFTDFSNVPPRPLFAILIPLPFLLLFAFSKKGSALIKSSPPHWLIGMQAFRILVELLLWRASILQLLPVQMTFEGYNFDVLSGVLAIIVAIALKRKWLPKLVLAYNIVGLLLLLNILVIAMLSMPTPFRYFMNEPANTLVAEFPFIYLPSVLVVTAYGLHIFSLRQWWLLRKNNPAPGKEGLIGNPGL